MFWCPLVGANRPPTKQAMPVARQVICVCVSFGRSLCRYNSPFHAVKKGHYCERSELLIRQVYQFELGCIKKIAH